MKNKLYVIVLATLILGVVSAEAQMSDTDYLEQLRTEIAADRQAIVAANLGLSDAQGEAFWPIYREYRAEMATVGDRMQKLIMDFAETSGVPTEDEAKAMVDEMISIQGKEHKVRKSYVKKFRKVLPETKVARFLQIENKLDIIVKLGIADAVPLAEIGD